MPALTVAQVKSLVNNSYNRVAPALSQTLNAELGSILKSIPALKGQNIAPISQAIAESASKDILKSLGSIHDVRDISKVITVETIRNVEANEAVNPGLEDIDLEGIFKQINKRAEEIAKQNGLSEHAALQGISDTLDLPQKIAAETALISKEAENYAREEHLIGTGETAESLKKHTREVANAYHNEFANQAALLMGGRSTPTLEQVRKAKEEAYNRAYSAIVANLNKTSKYQEHLRDFSQNVMPMLGYKPLSPREEEELGVGAAEPNLSSFINKTKFSAKGVGLALASSPRAQKEAFYSLLTHNQDQFEADYKEVSNQVEQFSNRRDSLTHNQRKTYVDARKRYAILRNARSFSKNNPGKVATYIDTFQSMEVGYRANWAAGRARATLNALTGGVPSIPAFSMPNRTRDVFMSKRFFGGLAFTRNNFKFGSAKAFSKVAQGAKMANPELMVANKALGWGKKFVALNLAGLFGLGMYFLALGKAVFMGFVIGASIGGTAGAIAGGIIGFQIGVALAPFTFGLSIPVFTFLGVAVGGAAGAFLGGIVGGLIAYGLQTGGATAVATGVGAGVGGTIGGVVGFNVGAGLTASAMTVAIGGCIASVVCAPFAPFLIAVSPAIVWAGGFLGGIIGAYAGTLIGATAGYLIGHYVVPVFSSVVTSIENFFAGAFAGTTATTGGILSAITGTAAAVWSGLSGAGGAVLGFLGNVGGAIWGSLSGVGVSASTALTPVAATFGAITTVGLIGGTITAATFFNPEGQVGAVVTGENEYFTILKTAIPNNLDEPTPATDITFTIILTAKDLKLTNITLDDNLRVDSDTIHEGVSGDKDRRNINSFCSGEIGNQLEAGQSKSCEFTIQTQADWQDSTVSNTVSIQATPEGKSALSDSATAIVIIGNPPLSCPTGWPLDTGFISQGPEGSTSHRNLLPEEAIDIAGNPGGTPTKTTFSGIVQLVDTSDAINGYGYHVDISGNCNGVPFVARWAHLEYVDGDIQEGNSVNFGDVIGGIDATGHVEPSGEAGTHLHYSFFDLRMQRPFIPQNLPIRACGGSDQPECEISW